MYWLANIRDLNERFEVGWLAEALSSFRRDGGHGGAGGMAAGT